MTSTATAQQSSFDFSAPAARTIAQDLKAEANAAGRLTPRQASARLHKLLQAAGCDNRVTVAHCRDGAVYTIHDLATCPGAVAALNAAGFTAEPYGDAGYFLSLDAADVDRVLA